MAITTQYEHLEDARPVPGLTFGVKPWSAALGITGDNTGGALTFDLRFNPSSSRTFQPYVAIYEVSFWAETVDPTDGMSYANSSQWEDLVRIGHGGQSPIANLVSIPITQGGSTQWLAIQRSWRYLGRTAQGTPGAILTRFPNVENSVMRIYMRGLIGDEPFFVPSELAV